MRSSAVLWHRLEHQLRAAAYLAGLVLVVGLSAWLVVGLTGLVWFGAAVALSMALAAAPPAHAVMRLRGAQRLAPLEAPDLHLTVQRLARKAGLARRPTLYLAPGGPQAFTVGDPSDPAIALSPALLRTLPQREVEAVIAHELGHVVAGDTRLLMVTQLLRRSLGTLLFIAPIAYLFGLLGSGPSLSLGLLPLIIFAPAVAGLAELGLSRTRELSADVSAAAIMGEPHSLAAALQRIDGMARRGGLDLSRLVPESLRSHPPTEQRVARLLAMADGPRSRQLEKRRRRLSMDAPMRPMTPTPAPARVVAVPSASPLPPRVRIVLRREQDAGWSGW